MGLTCVEDILVQIKRMKWSWIGHVMRIRDNRWTMRLTEWLPRDMVNETETLGRWRDELNSGRRMNSTSSRWKPLDVLERETYVLQWTQPDDVHDDDDCKYDDDDDVLFLLSP